MPSPINIAELRRRNLREWINRLHQGRQIDFVSATGINQGELSALLKNKPFGERKARKIEHSAGMPALWLDTDHSQPASAPQPTQRNSHPMSAPISTIPEILADLKAGKMVIITDAEDRENEGDLLMAAQFVTPEAINFMIKHARGLVCLPMAEELVDKLKLPLMTQHNGAQYGTNFTVSIEAAHGISTGISAADRALTIQTAVSPAARPEDIVQPGHIFPLRAQKGGVLVRAGHTEAGVDLAQMCGLIPAAVICEIINDDGTMARMPELTEFAQQHGLKIGTITDLIEYRSRTETLVRVHEPFSAMDFLQTNPRHSWPLPQALERIQAAEHGVAILLHRTEDGAALLDRTLPKGKNQTRQWDSKTYGIGAQILANLHVKKMRVLGQPSSLTGLTGFGLEVTGFESME